MTPWSSWTRIGAGPRAAVGEGGEDAGGGSGQGANASGASQAGGSTPPSAPPAPPPSTLAHMTSRMLAGSMGASANTTALNPSIVQAVQMTNAETTGYAPSQIAIGPDMMISQAAGLVAHSAANYFDGVSKLVLASQGVLLKELAQNLVEQNIEGAAEDALGIVATDLLLGAAAAVAAAAGAMEAESASFAIDKIDKSIATYSSLLSKKPPAEPASAPASSPASAPAPAPADPPATT
ncbi:MULTISPECIES: hypothetical protein [Dyella]|uniref:hypothetical protein n=1 Tax=Dyella TaxID=231454 RepID=UPI00197AB4DC|nr:MULTISPECIES: hypothetical protein [Dyella]